MVVPNGLREYEFYHKREKWYYFEDRYIALTVAPDLRDKLHQFLRVIIPNVPFIYESMDTSIILNTM